jgi:hypothetical protein
MKALFTSLIKLYAHMLGKKSSKEIVHNQDLRDQKYRILNELITGISDILVSGDDDKQKSSKYQRVMDKFRDLEKDGFSCLDIHSSEGRAFLRDFIYFILYPILLFIPSAFEVFKEWLAPKSAVLFNQAKSIFQQTAEADFNSISIV